MTKQLLIESFEFLKELTEIYSVGMAKPKFEGDNFERFYSLVNLVETYGAKSLFPIEWTKRMSEIKSFSSYQDV